MAKPSSASPRLFQNMLLTPLHSSEACYHQLGNSITPMNLEGFRTMVYQHDADLTSIVGIDGARRVKHRDAALDREAATRANLRFEAGRQCNLYARGDQLSLAGLDHDVFFFGERGAQINAGALLGGIRGQGKPFAVGQYPKRYANGAFVHV